MELVDEGAGELSKVVLMGRKKQKVRWTSVEDAGFFDSELTEQQPAHQQYSCRDPDQGQPPPHTQPATTCATGSSGQQTGNNSNQTGSDLSGSASAVSASGNGINCMTTSTGATSTFHQRHNSDSSMRRGGGSQNGDSRGNFVSSKYPGHVSGHNGSSRRSGGGGFWSNASLPPRFERSKQANATGNGAGPQSSGSTTSGQSNNPADHQYELDSNFETEELPNGFTKIRSKNLDVLFRKDYYAQRMLSTTSSSAVSSEAGEPVSASEIQDTDLDVINNLNNEPVAEENEEEIERENSNSDNSTSAANSKEATPPPQVEKQKEATPDKENKPEKKPIVEIKNSKINTNAVPFYPSTYVPPHPNSNTSGYQIAGVPTGSVSAGTGNAAAAAAAAAANSTTARPSLFLYSPSSNTMIPCEEIIIPNAVMPGTDVYQGPSNIYLAFPTDGTNPTGGGQGPGGVSQSPVSGNSATSPGTSSNCTPPQAQSPPNSYIDATTGLQATAGPGGPATTGTPAMVQYDPYGVPYTTYTPVMPNSSHDPSQSSGSASSGGCPTSTDCSSADSTTPHSPPDLSVYNPANWVPDPAYLAQAAAGGLASPAVAAASGGHPGGHHPYQYYPYYQHHHPSSYYNFRNGHASYQYLIESSAVPSSAGESQNEDRSEGEETSTTTTSPNTATTTTSNSPKKEPHGGVAHSNLSNGTLNSNKNQQSESPVSVPYF